MVLIHQVDAESRLEIPAPEARFHVVGHLIALGVRVIENLEHFFPGDSGGDSKGEPLSGYEIIQPRYQVADQLDHTSIPRRTQMAQLLAENPEARLGSFEEFLVTPKHKSFFCGRVCR